MRHSTTVTSADGIDSEPFSTFSAILETFDDYGIDILAMLLLFWCFLTALVIAGGNLYFRLTRPSKKSEKPASLPAVEEVESHLTPSIPSSPDLENRLSLFKSPKEWIEKVLEWIPDYGTKEVAETWLLELNERSRKLTADNGLFVEFVPVTSEQFKDIQIDTIDVQKQQDNSLLASANLRVESVTMQVRVSSSARDTANGQFALYDLQMDKFSSLAKVVCKPDRSQFVLRFSERPQTKIQINQLIKSDKAYSEDAIINAVLNILSTTIVDFNFHYSSKFPRYFSTSSNVNESVDSFVLPTNEVSNGEGVNRSLFVTVIQANNLKLNSTKEGHEVYCSLDLNGQNKQTAIVRSGGRDIDNNFDNTSPNWRAPFLFPYPEDTDLRVTLFDAFRRPVAGNEGNNSQDEMLGSAVVLLTDLKQNPSEKLTVPLLDKNGNFGAGTVEIELLLIEHRGGEEAALPGDSLPASPSPSPLPPPIVAKKSATLATGTGLNSSQHPRDYFDENGYDSNYNPEENGLSSNIDLSSQDLPPRPNSRSSTSHKSMMRAIRKRFSFSKQRSKSVERNTSKASATLNGEGQNGDASSSMRRRDDDRSRSVPPGSRENSVVRETIMNGKKQATSFMSLISSNSYAYDASTLVIEVTVNGEVKHFVVKPEDKSYRKRFRKPKPTKLHLYSDHVFIAQHAASSQRCDVCHKSFPLRLGKQAYKCRDCGALTHKPCHVTIEHKCPQNGASKLNFDFLEPLDNNNMSQASVTARSPSPLPQVRVFTPPPDDLDAMIHYDEKRIV